MPFTHSITHAQKYFTFETTLTNLCVCRNTVVERDYEEFKKLQKEFDITKVMSDFKINKQDFIKEREGDIYSYYDFGVELGKGAYGVVYEATEKETQQLRAIKKINKDNIKNEQRFFNELTALKTLDHPHIIKLFEIFEDDENVYLVQEFCSGGELFDNLAEQDHFDETYAAVIFEQILKALWYCHNNKICHRDLKPENFMFSSKDDNASLKLIDFGLSRSFFHMTSTGQRALLRMQTKAGTAFFMSPEVIQGNYSNSCDMWSAGCILYLMLSGYPPFDGETQEEIFASILEGKYDFDDEEWEGVSDDAKDLINQLLTNENDRLSAKNALKHSWIKTHVKKSKKKGVSTSHLKRLKDFSKMNKVRKIVCSFLASRVSNEEIEKQLESFIKLDKNKDGYITFKELKKGLGSEYTDEQIREIMDSVDTDKNGAIDYNEFVAATLDAEIAKNLKKLEVAFKYFDSNQDGFIDGKELKKALDK